MRGVATQWAPEGNEWRIQTHQAYGASRADTGRLDADAIRRTHILFLLMSTVPDTTESLQTELTKLIKEQWELKEELKEP